MDWWPVVGLIRAPCPIWKPCCGKASPVKNSLSWSSEDQCALLTHKSQQNHISRSDKQLTTTERTTTLPGPSQEMLAPFLFFSPHPCLNTGGGSRQRGGRRPAGADQPPPPSPPHIFTYSELAWAKGRKGKIFESRSIKVLKTNSAAS